MIRHCFILFLLFIVILGCKKYPKNKFPIILQPPEMTLKKLNGAKLKYFKINGADSTWVIEKSHPNARELEFKYPDKDHRGSFETATYGWGYGGGTGTLNFSKDKKKIKFSGWAGDGSPFSHINRYGPYPRSSSTEWNIIKLTGKELILQTTLNNREYEMAFSK